MRAQKLGRRVAFGWLMCLAAAGCGPTESVQVVCTTGQVADIVRAVAGGQLQVEVLMAGEGVDPHLYQPSPQDISRLKTAEVIFYSGHHLEGKFDQIFKQMAGNKPTVAVTEAIPEDKLLHEDQATDPHIWFDPLLWSEAVAVVAETLAQQYPEHADTFRANSEKYRESLTQLNDKLKAELETIPEQQRVLVTAHDAFHYFGRAFGLEVRAIQGISTESEASTREMAELVQFLVDNKIKAIFVEKSVSNKNVEALVEGCKQQNHEIVIGGELYSDSMGAPGTPAGTYTGMMEHNVRTIVEALK